MDIQGFLIECWKAVELYNSGKIDSKPWEQLEVLKDAIRPQDFSPSNAAAMRNIISALKKMFKGERYQELYFLKKDIGADTVNPLLCSFRWALISLVHAALGKPGELDKADEAWEISRRITVEDPCFSIRSIAWGILRLNWGASNPYANFDTSFDYALSGANYLDPLLATHGVIDYPYKVSWMANALMRATALAHFQDSADDQRLTQYATYLNTGGRTNPADVVASDLGCAQQAACAAYFVTCRRSNNLNILQKMEDTNKERLRFISGISLLANTDLSSNKSLFYVLRRWNSFTPIVPNLEQRQRIYRGGGYFFWHQNQGTVMDPGFRFIRNFCDAGGRVADIDNIVITHAHDDHTADLESLFTVLYQHNATIKDTLKEFGAYLPDLQTAYEAFLAATPAATDTQKKSFLASLKNGVPPAAAFTREDWNRLREILRENDMTVGTIIIRDQNLTGTQPGTVDNTGDWADTDTIDRAIIAMCLPKDRGNLTYSPDGTANTVVAPQSPEDALKAAGHAKKKVQVYANLGTMRKFNAVIDPDSQYIDYIGGVHVIEPGQTYYLANKGKANELRMIVHKAYHLEVVTKNYATGIEFQYRENQGQEYSTRNILITSDTSLCWTFKPNKTPDDKKADYTQRQNLQYLDNEVLNNYPGDKPRGASLPAEAPDLLLAHIGSIKDYEVSPPSFNPKDFIYKNHLGIIGTTQVIARIRPRIALITEFGEEMTEAIRLSTEMVGRGVAGLHRIASGAMPARVPPASVLPADIGLMFHLNENKYYGTILWAHEAGRLVWPVNDQGDVAAGIEPDALDVDYTTITPAQGAAYDTFPVTYTAR